VPAAHHACCPAHRPLAQLQTLYQQPALVSSGRRAAAQRQSRSLPGGQLAAMNSRRRMQARAVCINGICSLKPARPPLPLPLSSWPARDVGLGWPPARCSLALHTPSTLLVPRSLALHPPSARQARHPCTTAGRPQPPGLAALSAPPNPRTAPPCRSQQPGPQWLQPPPPTRRWRR